MAGAGGCPGVSRFVCANTGEMLKCPSPNSTGLSMDHFNAKATEFHFNYFIERLQETLGDIGNTPITISIYAVMR